MFADELDRASEYELFETQERIRIAASHAKKRLPESPGFCDACGDPTLTPDHLFCCSECRAADEKREYLLRIQGRHHE